MRLMRPSQLVLGSVCFLDLSGILLGMVAMSTPFKFLEDLLVLQMTHDADHPHFLGVDQLS